MAVGPQVQETLLQFPNRKSEAYLYGAQLGTAAADWVCRRHLHHMMFELNLVLEGTQLAEIAGSTFRQSEDHLILVPPMLMHAYRAEGPFRYFVMHVQVDDPEFLNRLNQAKVLLLEPDHPLNRLLLPDVKAIMALLQHDNPPKTRLFRSVYAIMDTLDAYIAEHTESDSAVDDFPIRIAKELESLVADRLQDGEEAIAAGWMEAMADRLGFSRRHCYRVFRETYKLSPREYLAVLRQQEAMHLLASSDYAVEAIGRRIGYDNAQSFSRQFVKWTGMTPVEFRKQSPGKPIYLTPLELA